MVTDRRANWFAMLWSGGVALCLVYLPAIILPALGADRWSYERTATGELTGYRERTVGPLDGATQSEYVSVLVPLLLAIVPLLVSRSDRWRRRASVGAAALVALYVVLGMMTVGLLYLPAAVALALAAAAPSLRSRSPA
jgi:uncharacterized membrane protein YhaH (DUF805 family)